MTVDRSEYLNWAIPRYHHLRLDLASSGTPAVKAGEMGLPPGADDFAAWDAFARFLAEREGWRPDEVLATQGATGAVTAACAALVRPGDRVLVERPAYDPLSRIPAAFGAEVVRFDRRFDSGWVVDPDAVSEALGPRTRLVIVTEPNNPTGAFSPPALIAETSRRVRAAGGFLLVNEVYRRFHSVRSARRLDPEILVADSVTKFEGLGWARGGWLSGPAEVVARARDAQTVLSVTSPVGAAFARAALDRPDLAERAHGFACAAKRARVDDWVASEPRLRWVEPNAGLFGFVRVEASPDLCALAERMRAEHGLLFAPGCFFGSEDGLRISWNAPVEALETGLGILGRELFR